MIIQILLILFFVFAVIRVVARHRSGDLTREGMIMWIIFWTIASVVVAKPDYTFYFARMVGVGRGADLVVYISLATAFFIIFRMMVRQEKLNRDLTKLTRKIALVEKKEETKVI